MRATTPQNITSGLKSTGIFPLDRNVFDDAAFLPSQVTNNPNPEETFPDRLSSDVALEEQPVNAQLPEPSAGCSYQQEQPSLATGCSSQST